MFGIPHPVTFVTDRDGKVVSKHFEQDIRDRFTASNILRIRSGGREIATKRLTLRSSGSNAVVRGGERVRLSVEVKLKPRMHVYAPGVTGYIPIEWKMDESAAAKVHPTEFPRAARIHLKAIRETVPAYEGQFTLDREITVAQEKAIKPLLNAEGELTLSGSFRYQACDDKKCYLPETVPLKWTFRFEPHDPTRVAPELQHKLGTRR